MRHTFHIATGQYEFMEQTFDGTSEDAVEAYKELKKAWDRDDGLGLPSKLWNKWIDDYLSGRGAGSVEEWEQMSKEQKIIINEIKKSLKRTNET